MLPKVFLAGAAFVLLPLSHVFADQLAIWTFPSLSGLGNGSSVNATTEVASGTPTVTIRNSDIYATGQGGVAFTDATGVSQAANRAIGWSDFKKSGQSVDGQFDIAFNATGWQTMTLRFDYKHSKDNDSSQNRMQWIYSTNGGSSWSSATPFTVTDNNAWGSKSFTLPAALNGQSNIVVRLEKDTNDSNATEVNNILLFDNIEITGSTAAPASQSPVLTISSNAANLPNTNPVALSGAVGDTADPARTAITISPTDADTLDANLTAGVTSSQPSVATASLTKSTVAGQDSYALTITPAGVGYTNIVVTISDPQSNAATYTVQYAVSAASSTPSASRYHTGASDLSTAIALDANWMLAANDEDQVIRLYDRNNSGLPIKTFDANVNLGLAKEADFEATIRLGNRIYWIGSHGNDREGNSEPTRNMSCAYDVAGTGAATTLTFVNKFTNLRSNLIAWDNANGHGLGSAALGLSASAAAGVLPTVANGFNIEGAALSGSNVLLGFRAPLQSTSARDKALVIPVTNFATVVNSGSGTMTFGAPVFLDLGGRAIRSMANTPSGQILVLAGPVGDSSSISPAFALFLWNGSASSKPVRLSSSLDSAATNGGGSPEAIVDPPAEIALGSQVQVIQDNGTTIFYNDGTEAKDLAQRAYAKSRSDVLTIGTTRTVTTAVDENNVNPGTGTSLREAIAAALYPDAIAFAPALNGSTITLAHGQLTLGGSLALDASSLSEGLTLSGNQASRVLEVASGASTTLRGLHLISGRMNGGSFPSNAGGVIFNNGGNLTLEGCTLSGGVASGHGGAIYSATGALTLTNCTVAGNSAGNQGGGIYLASGTLTLQHATLSTNIATFQGGGLAQAGGTAVVNNSIIAGNNAPTSANVSGTITGSHNLISGSARLAPLADYGGRTPTMPPLPGSPAIEAGAASSVATDQRGAARPAGPLPDAGAVEALSFNATTLVDTDGDGIDDRLEPAYGLTVGADDSDADTDGDGQTDAEEIANMTDPADASSHFVLFGLTQIGVDAGSGGPVFTFTVPTFPGMEYELETSQTLADFALVPGSSFVADGFSETLQITLRSGRDFVRVVRK